MGECGLDYHYDRSPREVQRELFATQVRLAKALKKPVVVHTREADADTADILERELGPDNGVIHCFTGDWAAAQRYLALGLHISLSGVLTFKAADALREAAARIPLERLLVETDCPFLTPVPHRGKRNEPAYVRLTAERLAEVRGIPLAEVSTSMTINAPAALLLLLYELVGEQQGMAGDRLQGTVQNDILKEYAARGTYIFPPRPSMRLTTDLFAYCHRRLPNWNTISVSGYHLREAGATAVQELGFTMAHAIAYVEAARTAGLNTSDFAPRVSFFFAVFSDFFEEIAKFRAARSLWAGIMRDRFGAPDGRGQALRFHTQTGGSTLTAQQPYNNIVRVALQAMSAVLGGTQSLHANSFDEALGLPSELAATLSVRTQQIIAHESNVASVADPLGGSYLVEALTKELEIEARTLIDQVDRRGGAIAAIESGFTQEAIQESAYRFQQAVEDGRRFVVGVNRFQGDEDAVDVVKITPKHEREQIEALARLRTQRDGGAVAARLEDIRRAAVGTENLLPPMREALRAYATIGEVCGVLREVFGEYRPGMRS